MKKIKTLEYGKLEMILKDIQKPGRYVDHEIGTLSKDPAELENIGGNVFAALAFQGFHPFLAPLFWPCHIFLFSAGTRPCLPGIGKSIYFQFL